MIRLNAKQAEFSVCVAQASRPTVVTRSGVEASQALGGRCKFIVWWLVPCKGVISRWLTSVIGHLRSCGASAPGALAPEELRELDLKDLSACIACSSSCSCGSGSAEGAS